MGAPAPRTPPPPTSYATALDNVTSWAINIQLRAGMTNGTLTDIMYHGL